MKEFCLNNNNDPILIIKDYVTAVRYNEKNSTTIYMVGNNFFIVKGSYKETVKKLYE